MSWRGIPLAAVACVLAALAVVADRALVREAAGERVAADARADESARLSAQAALAALARIEQAVAEDRAPRGVVSWRVVVPPDRVPRSDRGGTHAARSRSELVPMLDSTEISPQGLPQAVVAALALDEAPAKARVAERLLEGRLPILADDVAVVAEELGVADDPRVERLVERLDAAPAAGALPAVPSFRRRFDGSRVEGWAREGTSRVRYDISALDLLRSAGIASEARVLGQDGAPRGAAFAQVPEVAGLRLFVEPRAPRARRFVLLRAALWLAVTGCVVAVLVVLRSLRSEARVLAREKAFLAGATHELRSPLASIRLLAQTLADGRGDPREYGRLIAGESERLESLTEQVLAAARADAAPRLAPVDPEAIARSVVALMEPRAERRRVALTCEAVESPVAPQWDEDAIRGALLNLVDNAIKHGPEGGRVRVGVAWEGDRVEMSVTDDGPGIQRKDRRRVFGRFERGETTASGTGLGLHLVEQAARAHGGRVDLRVGDESGCTFVLSLPVHPPAAQGARP